MLDVVLGAQQAVSLVNPTSAEEHEPGFYQEHVQQIDGVGDVITEKPVQIITLN